MVDLAAAEDHEIAAWRDLAAAAVEHGLVAGEQGRAFLTAAPAWPIYPFNRVVGIGRHASPTVKEIDDVAAWYSDRGVDRYWLQLGTRPVPPPVEQWLAAHRCVLEYRSVLLGLDLRTPFAGAGADLQVRRVSADEGADFSRVAATSFGWPVAAQGLGRAVVGRAGWRHYLLCDGPAAVGCGAAYETDGLVWLGFAGVLASHRRRGGQAALIARRLEDTTRESHTAIVDVAQGTSSHRNCLRAGFVEIGVRPIYRVVRRHGVRRLLGF